tara:strand:+ start:583 stop:2130 length:1548 start_codon:yes stop_codon:yes gene_type:complete
MLPEECLYCYNLVPSEYGLRLRKGYREWAIGLNNPVNTIIGFEGQAQDESSSKLFAITLEGIWNVTTYGTTISGVPDVVFSDNGPTAGYGVFTEMTNDAGSRILAYADEANGLFYYYETGLTWLPIPTFTLPASSTSPFGPPLAADIVYAVTWKNRLWFIERDTAYAWYLQPGAIQGEATPFNFGAKFVHGGEIKAIFNWTVDGGLGVDDILVVVSGGGDVLTYKGTDPNSIDTFELIGAYYVGSFPASRKVGLTYGGELYLISTFGVISVRQLMQGILYEDPSLGPSAKINRYLRDAVESGRESYDWSMTIYPSDGFLQIIAPYNLSNNENAIQYQQNLMTQAWGLWRGVPIRSAASWKGLYLIGTPDGRVVEYYGSLDNSSTFAGGPTGTSIDYSILTSYQAPAGNTTSYKKVNFIRPIQVTRFQINAVTRAIYDYEFDAMLPTPNGLPNSGGDDWDAATWDASIWSGQQGSESTVDGVLGQGRVIAVAMRGRSSDRLTFVSWDIDYQTGGFL